MSDTFKTYIALPPEVYLKRPLDEPFNGREPNIVKLKDVEISEDGMFTTFEGIAYRKKGFSHLDFEVRAVAVMKKAILSALRIAVSAPYLIPFLWFARKKILLNLSRFSNAVLRDFYLQPKYFISSGQEIYNAIIKPYDRDSWRIRVGDAFETHFNLAMLVVMLWEYDDAYRYRGQFVLSWLDKQNLLNAPRKELRRLCDILIGHESAETMKDKWRGVKKIIPFLPLKKFADILLELDLDKFRLDEEDLYWARLKEDFDYSDLPIVDDYEE